MANDKKKINELVTDDEDSTAEFEALPVLQPFDAESETSADTCGLHTGVAEDRNVSISKLQSDLRSRSKTINRLQFDIERLHAKWLGLETEIEAREDIASQLQQQVAELGESSAGKDDALLSRDESIKSLEAEIRDKDTTYQDLASATDAARKKLEADQLSTRRAEVESLSDQIKTQQLLIGELQHDNDVLVQKLASEASYTDEQDRQMLALQAGQLASNNARIKEFEERFERSEQYADTLRQQLLDRNEITDVRENTGASLQLSLDRANQQIGELSTGYEEEKAIRGKLSDELKDERLSHAEEIRVVRFELSQAQDTVSQHETIYEQLASDLTETRDFRSELEKMLNETEAQNKARIDELEEENGTFRRQSSELQNRLETKSEAINCLLAELADKTQQIESIGQIEDVIQEIDDRMSVRIDERVPVERDRVTRLLVGTIDGQELRFPLFKDRLTIGRSQQNDIQLKASYISRRHAVIIGGSDATRIVDWGSKNGVFVNSRRVTEHFLKNGDVVAIGTAEFHYEERPKRDA